VASCLLTKNPTSAIGPLGLKQQNSIDPLDHFWQLTHCIKHPLEAPLLTEVKLCDGVSPGNILNTGEKYLTKALFNELYTTQTTESLKFGTFCEILGL